MKKDQFAGIDYNDDPNYGHMEPIEILATDDSDYGVLYHELIARIDAQIAGIHDAIETARVTWCLEHDMHENYKQQIKMLEELKIKV